MKRYLLNVLYNLDRLVATILGAPVQETLSSFYFGRRNIPGPLDDVGCKVLDALDKNHCADAIKHADKLDAADDGVEQ